MKISLQVKDILFIKQQFKARHSPRKANSISLLKSWSPFRREAKKLTHCILIDNSTVKCQMSPVVILGVSGLFCHVYSIF